MATARACLKLWIGFPPKSAAVTSAGSGPAMRCAIIGAVFANDELRRKQFVSASSNLTHRGWQAELAAQSIAACVALATRFERQPNVPEVMAELRPLSNEKEWQQLLSSIETGLQHTLSVEGFAKELGLGHGVSGYSLHVVPIALFAWLRHPGDFSKTLMSALECGGDTDTVGAIAGALAGSVTGDAGIPEAWVNRICEWPRSVSFIRCLAKRLALQSCLVEPLGTLRYFWPGTLVRNVVFLIVVLAHGFRRLLPPY
jgi:ADP-ribosylglycohydrolase